MGASLKKQRHSGLTQYAHKTHLVIIETPYKCRPTWSHCYPEDPLGLGSLDELTSDQRCQPTGEHASKNQFMWPHSQMPNHLNPEVAATADLLDRNRSNS